MSFLLTHDHRRPPARPSEPAPGWPGIAPTWASSAKDMVTPALGPSRVWATLGFGIVNEVYWPSASRPQIRDLGFIVAGRSQWHEVKWVARYQLRATMDVHRSCLRASGVVTRRIGPRQRLGIGDALSHLTSSHPAGPF